MRKTTNTESQAGGSRGQQPRIDEVFARSTKGIEGVPAQPLKKSRTNATCVDSFDLDRVPYRVGDDVYVMKTRDRSALSLGDDVCCVCNESRKRDNMLECSRCLGGFHMECLTPRMEALPQVRR